MERVAEIKERRVKANFIDRMKGKKEQEKMEMQKDVEKNIELIRSPMAVEKEKIRANHDEMDIES